MNRPAWIVSLPCRKQAKITLIDGKQYPGSHPRYKDVSAALQHAYKLNPESINVTGTWKYIPGDE